MTTFNEHNKASLANRATGRICCTILAIFFALTTVAFLVAFVAVFVRNQDLNVDIKNKNSEIQTLRNNQAPPVEKCKSFMPDTNQNSSSLSTFDDLTAEEYKMVRDFVNNNMSLTSYEAANVSSDYIFMVDLLLPSKQEVIAYMNGTGSKPTRRAKVIVYHGKTNPPVVKEYTVEPLPSPTSASSVMEVNWNKRPMDKVEMMAIENMVIVPMAEKLNPIFEEKYNATYGAGCNHCLTYHTSSPHGSMANERKSWIWFTREVSGAQDILHPVGVNIFISHAGVNYNMWKIEKLVFQNKQFDTVDEFITAYNNSNKTLVDNLPWPTQMEMLDTSTKQHGSQLYSSRAQTPKQYEPDGQRFKTSGRHLEYMEWKFDFRMSPSQGLQLYDIRYRDERIVYELGMQEAATIYGGYNPISMMSTYLHTSMLPGTNTYELVKGIDCPENAIFYNTTQYVNGQVVIFKNSVCAFELNTGLPLRRHYGTDRNKNFRDFGGMVDNVLVLRSIFTIFDEDIIIDYIFHLNGALEVRNSFSGIPQASRPFTRADEFKYGYPVYKNLGATFNHRLLNFKCDIDIKGLSNRIGQVSVKVNNISNPWFPNERSYLYNVGTRTYHPTETVAALKFNFNEPAYLLFFNDLVKNNFGAHRTYRLKVDGISKLLLPEDENIEPGLSWGRYQVAITKHSDAEPSSSSIYNGVNPSQPVVKFQDFIDNNENIADQDLVAWITVGSYMYPSTDEFPSISTTGTQTRFFLLPLNYNDQEPSTASNDSVYMYKNSETGMTMINRTSSSQCLPPKNYMMYSMYGQPV